MLDLLFALCGRFIVLGAILFVVAPIMFMAELAGAVAGVVS